jgi:hypothetical protein
MVRDSLLRLRRIRFSILLSAIFFAFLAFPSFDEFASVSFAGNFAIRLENFPKTILWAWERPERLKFIDPQVTGVAFLARTLKLRGDEVVVRPRLQPLEIPPRTVLTAVVRIETDKSKRPALSSSQIEATVGAIRDVGGLANVRAVQIDFDAILSERQFYRRVLNELRYTLLPQLPISITALASWCIHDDWLSNLPIDDAVPMLFRMGVGQRQVVNYLSTHSGFKPEICRQSVGTSVDDPLQYLPPRNRTYVFNPQPWNMKSVNRILKESAK